MTLLLVLQILGVIGLAILGLLLNRTLPSYLSEKGKNLATKEDIGSITESVENVKAAVNQGVEIFKLSLSQELHQFTTQFSRLDQQRATGVMQIHGLMCDIEQLLIWHSGAAATARISVTPEARTMEALNKAWEGIARLNQVLNYHALLLNERVYQRVQGWSSEVMAVVAAIGNEVEPLRTQASNTHASLEDREAVLAAIRDKHLDTALARLGKIRKELEGEFRAILGGAG